MLEQTRGDRYDIKNKDLSVQKFHQTEFPQKEFEMEKESNQHVPVNRGRRRRAAQ